MTHKTLYRSVEDRMIAGVCGGIAEYFDIDATIVRLLAILLVIANGVGIVLYIAAWIIMPENPKQKAPKKNAKKTSKKVASKAVVETKETNQRGSVLIGLGLVAIGIFVLVDSFLFTIPWHFVWPVALILAGIVLLIKK